MVQKKVAKKPSRFLKGIFYTFLFLGILLAFLVWKSGNNPLPKDEELITHFQSHRADFEELVWRYRQASGPPEKKDSDKYLNLGNVLSSPTRWVDPGWYVKEHNPELVKRAGVENIDYAAVGFPWLPNPYSQESLQIVEDYSSNKAGPLLSHLYGALNFRLSDARYRQIAFRHGIIFKTLYFIPEVPHIENGYLFYPNTGRESVKKRILDSLNDYPPNWKPFECVLRRIDTHWFINMCNSRAGRS